MPNNKLKLYHISLEINKTIENFIPRVPPQSFHYNEDSTIKRVCVSPKLEGIFYGMPNLMNYVMDFNNTDEAASKMSVLMEHNNKIGYLMKVYEFHVDETETMTDFEIYQKELVPDATLTGEHWLLKPTKPNDYFYLLLTKATYEPEKKCLKSEKFSYEYQIFDKNEIGNIRKATLKDTNTCMYEVKRSTC